MPKQLTLKHPETGAIVEVQQLSYYHDPQTGRLTGLRLKFPNETGARILTFAQISNLREAAQHQLESDAAHLLALWHDPN